MTSKYTESARGEVCLVRIPGICNHDPDTTVFAHLNGAGLAIRHRDIHGAYCCSDCHKWLDGGYTEGGTYKAVRDLWHLQAVIRTQNRMIEKGVLIL